MSLAIAVRQFVERVKRNPADGSDPAVLGFLERAARRSMDGFFSVLSAPVAPEEREAFASLPGATAQTDRIPLTFPRPIEILGYYPSIVVVGAGVVPTLDDLLVSIDFNLEEYQGASVGLTTSAAGNTFTTLGSWKILTPRLICKTINVPKPDLGFTFRWKRGPGFFADSLIGMAVFARYVDR